MGGTHALHPEGDFRLIRVQLEIFIQAGAAQEQASGQEDGQEDAIGDLLEFFHGKE